MMRARLQVDECRCYRGNYYESLDAYSRMRARNPWRVSLQMLQLPTNLNAEHPFFSPSRELLVGDSGVK